MTCFVYGSQCQTQKCAKLASQRTQKNVRVEDLMFLIRKDDKKHRKAKNILKMMEELKDIRELKDD